ncbi:glycosyltransferase family 4 protein [Micromonospora sp. HNM0581]|uniref:glycosyltransferase n=1 Tax=Micromonospora sp. HNM0581 TaxID=2716341 RepID=UPI00146B8BDE|nr:glycosyl transferase family 1 [Micromonospora sp. HNM0581]NLU78825.1 glycosyltransferase family 4 protein [Micromonospora sp. HNM0581]
MTHPRDAAPRTAQFPKVLVVGHMPFDRSTGTTITLSNLFHGWPKDRLAQVYTSPSEPSTEVCTEFLHFPPREHYPRPQYLALRMLGWNGTGPVQSMPALTAVRDAADRRSTVAAWYTHLVALGDLSPLHLPSRVTNWMRQYRPDVVYSMLGSVRLTRLAAHAARHCRVPVVPHFTDDWPATLYGRRELGGFAASRLHAAVRDLVGLAPCGMAISGPMAEEYQRRYGIPFDVFTNSVDADFFAAPPPPVTPARDRPANLVYVGALHLGRWRSLRTIAAGAAAISTAATPVRLTVHCPTEDAERYGREFAGIPGVHFGRSLASHEVPAVLAEADILVHVESFAEDTRRYTHYSVSTKIPQYLAAGRPIFGHGPAELASMAYVRSAGAGIVVGTPEEDVVTEQLWKLCLDSSSWHEFGRNGRAHAERHHRRERVATRFAEVLRQAAGTGAPRLADAREPA